MKLIIAEKPSVAKDISRALGILKKKDGYYEDQNLRITWAVGHLVALAEPQQINKEWQKWQKDYLPMLPQKWPLIVLSKSKKQYQVVKSLMLCKKTTSLICATDAGREGELIFRYIYEKASCSKPFQRLWLKSLTPQGIKNAFNRLKDGNDYNPLADSARARSRADWLVGMNLSRAYSLQHHETYSVGRVQTPTLAMIVDRDQAIKDFQPEEFVELKGIFAKLQNPEGKNFTTFFVDHNIKEKDFLKQRRLKAGDPRIDYLQKNFREGSSQIKKIIDKDKTIQPPLLYDLSSLQRHANQLFGFSAQKTLDICQKLYESKKMITYPRTDSSYVGKLEAQQFPKIADKIKQPYQLLLPNDVGQAPIGKPYVNEKKVTDHHAILPTGVIAEHLRPEEQQIYDLICRRFLALWLKPYVSCTKTIEVDWQITKQDEIYINLQPFLFVGKFTTVKEAGWKILEWDIDVPQSRRRDEDSSLNDSDSLPELTINVKVKAQELKKLKGKTKPPSHHNEASLLALMETAGSLLEDEELKEALKERGLGTPATRANIIEQLIHKKYIERRGRKLLATDKGFKLISLVHPFLKDPSLTGNWEEKLSHIEKNDYTIAAFMQELYKMVQRLVDEIFLKPIMNVDTTKTTTIETKSAHKNTVQKISINNSSELTSILKNRFQIESFRLNQEEICREVVKGENVLVVMPTGAGKSLCYQLPGIAMGGTTLIISPLIALMEDQVQKLQQWGFAAERIHCGRSRDESRDVCRRYLHDELDFLFVAPERLRLPGFISLLSKNKPALVAIDEAHCISQWGHDFRADYRRLKDRLQPFQPVPTIALTATANKMVQDDMIEQLGFEDYKKFICGFKRENIAIEVAPIVRRQRMEKVIAYLKKKSNLPCIIYAPTRKDTEKFAHELNDYVPTRPYHAGFPAEKRNLIQKEFMDGDVSVVVATVAFGMGIDKANVRSVIHMALPSNLSSYYQEIGRGGRDGRKSRAVLLYSYGDQKTIEFLHDYSYPDVKDLEKVLSLIPKEGIYHQKLMQIGGENTEHLLQKLWVHEGVVIDEQGLVRKADPKWKNSYRKQKRLRQKESEEVWDYAQNIYECRMKQLVAHFGEKRLQNYRCELCDTCVPKSSQFKELREPDRREKNILDTMWALLQEKEHWSKSSLYKEICGSVVVSKDIFDSLLSSLLMAGYVEGQTSSFMKGDKKISYQKLTVPHPSMAKKPKKGWEDLLLLRAND